MLRQAGVMSLIHRIGGDTWANPEVTPYTGGPGSDAR